MLDMPVQGANNVGFQGFGIGNPDDWMDLREGGALSEFANKIPGIN